MDLHTLRIAVVPDADDCLKAADYLVGLFGEIIPRADKAVAEARAALGVDLQFVNDMLHDAVNDAVGELEKKAEQLREIENEVCDLRGYAKALSWGVE